MIRLIGTFFALVLFEMMCSYSVTVGSVHGPFNWEASPGTKYCVHAENMTWERAKKFCEQRNGSLLLPKSEAENDFAISLLKKHGAGSAWLDCSDEETEGKWLCAMTSFRDLPFHNAAQNHGDSEDKDCGYFQTSDKSWYAARCDELKMVVCQRKAKGTRAIPTMRCMTLGPDGRPDPNGVFTTPPCIRAMSTAASIQNGT